ncbi:hypothetical protein D9M71_458320 [compost metagenome]
MVLGIEGFAVRVNRLEVVALEGVVEHLQGQLDTFAHRANVLVVGAGQFQATLEAVDDRQQVTGEFFQGELVRLFYILLGATAHVLQVGGGAQGLILGRRQLLFEHLHAGAQLLVASRFGVQILFIQLFVSHKISPLELGLRALLALLPPIWGRKTQVQGLRNSSRTFAHNPSQSEPRPDNQIELNGSIVSGFENTV